ncbi:hypothetical protein [Mycobacterium numidiamassiliense]|nr:hypothetical protein [Mycobacterium numidiamassiliense]
MTEVADTGDMRCSPTRSGGHAQQMVLVDLWSRAKGDDRVT